MTLTNYWWLIIWMFTGAAFFTVFGKKRREIINGKSVVRLNPAAAFMAVLPYIIWAGFRSNAYGDTRAYRETFLQAPSNLLQLASYVDMAKKDKGFSALIVIMKTLIGNSDILFFLLIALFQMGCIIYIYRKYSCDFWLSIFIFIATTDYMSWMHNGMRQFTAVMLVFLSTELLIKKKYATVVFFILLASTIHGSALLMLPAILIIQGKAWNKKTIMTLIMALIVIVMVDKFTGILDSLLAETQYSNMVTDWKEWNDDGTNPIRVLVYSVPMILSAVGIKWIRKEDNPMINLAANSSICATSLYIISMFTSGIFIGRLPVYFSLLGTGILIPWTINHIFTENSKRFVRCFAVVAYCLFFYYQMHWTWGIM